MYSAVTEPHRKPQRYPPGRAPAPKTRPKHRKTWRVTYLVLGRVAVPGYDELRVILPSATPQDREHARSRIAREPEGHILEGVTRAHRAKHDVGERGPRVRRTLATRVGAGGGGGGRSAGPPPGIRVSIGARGTTRCLHHHRPPAALRAVRPRVRSVTAAVDHVAKDLERRGYIVLVDPPRAVRRHRVAVPDGETRLTGIRPRSAISTETGTVGEAVLATLYTVGRKGREAQRNAGDAAARRGDAGSVAGGGRRDVLVGRTIADGEVGAAAVVHSLGRGGFILGRAAGGRGAADPVRCPGWVGGLVLRGPARRRERHARAAPRELDVRDAIPGAARRVEGLQRRDAAGHVRDGLLGRGFGDDRGGLGRGGRHHHGHELGVVGLVPRHHGAHRGELGFVSDNRVPELVQIHHVAARAGKCEAVAVKNDAVIPGDDPRPSGGSIDAALQRGLPRRGHSGFGLLL